MARCEDCLHYAVCCVQGKLVKTDEHNWYELGELGNVQDFCEHFIADVVPKSEYEQLKAELDKQKLWERLLKAESHAPIIKKAKQEVAMEIFEEIDELLVQNATMQIATSTLHCKLAELKNKYTKSEE